MSEKNSYEVLGLKRGIVSLREYTPLWEELYQEEEKRIRAIIGHLIIDIQHIGSTAIPNIKAKPILDMMVGMARLEDALSCQAPLEAIGYDYIAHADLPNDHVFGKGVVRTHFLHVVEYESAEWVNPLRFRDRLRKDAELARKYEKLKQELKERFGNNPVQYTSEKLRFIREVIAT
jgi:GrpB-like predicted nucleotidyltransferase (UPF0157 family)